MLVYVPQGYVALVYAGGQLRDVVEAGVGVVERDMQVQYVYLPVEPQPQLQPEDYDEEVY